MANAETILFGSDPTQGIVAVEPAGERIRIYRRAWRRGGHGGLRVQTLVADHRQDPLAGARWTELEGEGYRFIAEFADRNAYQNARYWLRDAHALHIALPTGTKQYLTRSGRTLFKGMAFDDIVRMQLDIETFALRPDGPESEVFLISISDNKGFQTQIWGEEPSVLREMVACIRERDPDVIEGHNIFGFDLPYLAARAKMHSIRLGIGRDGSEMIFSPQQACAIGYFSTPFVPAHIHGRQVIDTLLAVQRYDVAKGSLSSHGLKSVCHALGISETDRELIPGDKIGSEWRSNPERVKKYALQDVLETRSLAALICPPDFYLAQMVPDNYARAATTGTGEKINSVFIREYLRQGLAIPKASEPKPLPGGYTEVRATGVIERIVKCDVESLYPSIMLYRRIKPRSDTLDVFLPALEELTRRRFDAKAKSKEASNPQHAYWDGLQSAFKILINSFYGYLAAPLNFNDHDAAAQVTTTGQSVVKQIIEQLEKTGSTVIEVDTDGVFFQPPGDIDSEERETEYIDSIGSTLPAGIRLAHDGRYCAMISLKMKNYALATYDGKKIFRGSALRSRADEPFGLEFISKTVDYLLNGKPESAGELYQSIARKIECGELGLDKFTRRERITEKTFQSLSKKAHRPGGRPREGRRIRECVPALRRHDRPVPRL